MADNSPDFEKVRWYEEINWHLTVLSSTVLGMPGEMIYLLVLLIYFPSEPALKAVLWTMLFFWVIRLLGVRPIQVLRRWNRLRVGRRRSLYSTKQNIRRIRRGV